VEAALAEPKYLPLPKNKSHPKTALPSRTPAAKFFPSTARHATEAKRRPPKGSLQKDAPLPTTAASESASWIESFLTTASALCRRYYERSTFCRGLATESGDLKYVNNLGSYSQNQSTRTCKF
jgi:hypothetical protein